MKNVMMQIDKMRSMEESESDAAKPPNTEPTNVPVNRTALACMA